MDAGQIRSQLLEHGNGCGLIVYEHPALDSYLTAKNEVLFFGVDAVVFEDLGDSLFRSAFDPKNGRDHCPVGAETHQLWRCFVSPQQSQGIDEDALAGSSLSGQQVQPRSELNGEMIDDGVVL